MPAWHNLPSFLKKGDACPIERMACDGGELKIEARISARRLAVVGPEQTTAAVTCPYQGDPERARRGAEVQAGARWRSTSSQRDTTLSGSPRKKRRRYSSRSLAKENRESLDKPRAPREIGRPASLPAQCTTLPF